MSIRSSDGKNFRRVARTTGDRVPAVGIRRNKSFYTATGGELSLDLQSLSPQISYQPGQGQLEVKSSAGPMIEGLDYYETSATSITFPSPGLSAGERLEIIQTFQYSGNLVAQVRPDEYSQVASAGQTSVTADFSWPLNQNPSKRHGAIMVYLNGILQQRGSSQDYVEVSLGQANTNQIQFNSALVGGENISIVRTYQAIDETAAATQFNNTRLSDLQDYFKVGFQAFVDEQTNRISVPFTTITGRASIPDLTRDLKVRYGVERIPVQQIYRIESEFGPNGEPVWGLVGDDRGLVRFVGGAWTNVVGSYGTYPSPNGPTSYIEVTFYGTGLNALCVPYTGQSRNFSLNVDGVSYPNVAIAVTTQSDVLGGRNYNSNTVIPVIQGLSLGIHTVRLGYVTNSAEIFGFEILNVSNSNLVVNPGTAFVNGREINVLGQSASLLAKPATVTGTKGGRVVTYLDTDGTVKQSVTLTNASQANLSAADHTNEDVVRVYNWREFGAGRSDDFSLARGVSVNSGFTLEDGTTTLLGFQIGDSTVFSNIGSGFTLNSNTHYFTIVFVGTGLDIFSNSTGNGASIDPHAVSINGISVGNITATPNQSGRVIKVASGLPYGTHTVKVTRNGSTAQGHINFLNFIVYQPKKPTIPAGAVELADYNVMADFNGAGATDAQDSFQIPIGTLSKMCPREMAYVGTWSISSDPNYLSYHTTFTGTNSSYTEYTFYGTGVSIQLGSSGGGTYDFTVAINGTLNSSGVARSNASNLGGGSYRSTTVASGGNTPVVRIEFTGLALGRHTIRMTKTAGAGNFIFEALHIITPIHAHVSNSPYSFQNTLPVGSCSVSDSRLLSPVKSESPKKAAVKTRAINVNPTTTSTVFVPCPDLSVTISLKKLCRVEMNFYGRFACSGGNTLYFCIFINGIPQVDPNLGEQIAMAVPGTSAAISISDIIVLPAGTHKIDVYWAVNAGTATANSNSRSLTVKELD